VSASGDGMSVDREIEIAATPETVWGLLTDPAAATRWMGQVATFDVRPGGAYRLVVVPGGTVSGEFVVVEPVRHLVYTWGWEGSDLVPPGSTTVEFELAPLGTGTVLRLRHHRLPSEASATSHTRGWEHYLPRLVVVAEGGEPGPDPWITRQTEPAAWRKESL
jgi:uncharacterized protein YndB with AHSA1/START domain